MFLIITHKTPTAMNVKPANKTIPNIFQNPIGINRNYGL